MRGIVAAFGVLFILAGCESNDGDGVNAAPAEQTASTAEMTSPSSSASAAPPPPTATAAPAAPSTTGLDAIDQLDAALLDDEASDRAYWKRALELLQKQDDASLQDSGDVHIEISHDGELAAVYRDDLDSIAYNSCLGLITRDDAAQTVGWIKDAFELQRRWEAAQLRLAAVATKCPSLK